MTTRSSTETDTAEAKALLQLLRGPFAEYLSLSKLCSSRRFLDLLEHVATQALSRNNFNAGNLLLNILRGSLYQERLLRWCNDRLGADFSEKSGTLQMRPRKDATPRLVAAGEYFPEAASDRAAWLSAKRIAAIEARKGVVVTPSSADMMNIGRRLRGSFESGKKR